MAALAESLVDEWLNRQGFFTVRGIKHGVDEIDLLGIRPGEALLDAWHVEVQASFRPIGYIGPVTPEIAAEFSASKTSAKKRPIEIVRKCAESWVHRKFAAETKRKAREVAWPGLNWHFVFVHAVVREPAELKFIAEVGVQVIPLHRVLAELNHESSKGIRGGAGTDLSEVIEYFNAHMRASDESGT